MKEAISLLYTQLPPVSVKDIISKLDYEYLKKILFHIRIWNGLNSSDQFVYLMLCLFDVNRNNFEKILNDETYKQIGCYKDLIKMYCFTNTVLSPEKSKEIKNYIIKDLAYTIYSDLCKYTRGEKVSLVAKWIPTERSKYDVHNFVNNLSCYLGILFSTTPIESEKINFKLDGTKKSYRKICSLLREESKVTERLMSLKRKEEIIPTIKNLKVHHNYFSHEKSYFPINGLKDLKENYLDRIDEAVIRLRKEKRKLDIPIITYYSDIFLQIAIYYASITAILEENWIDDKLIGYIYHLSKDHDKYIYEKISIVIATREDFHVKRYSYDETLSTLNSYSSIINRMKETVTFEDLDCVVCLGAYLENIKFWVPSISKRITVNGIFGYDNYVIDSLINLENYSVEKLLNKILGI